MLFLKLYNQRINEHFYDDVDFSDGKFTVVYCGTIRPVNHVDLILDTAKLLGEAPSMSI